MADLSGYDSTVPPAPLSLLVVFREANERIEVLAVAHARRRPGTGSGGSRHLLNLS